MLVDSRKRHYLITLKPGGEFHSHKGVVAHDELIGAREGCVTTSTRNERYTALRPTLEDFILLMPRGAQVIYPKDLGPILMLADIKPGVRVFESGVGSGALSMAMLRAGADVVGLRDPRGLRQPGPRQRHQLPRAPRPSSTTRVELRDSYEGIDVGEVDRVILDLPEPWQVVPHAERVLVPGGSFCAVHPVDHPGVPDA